mmetsp:Transcript_15564/g.28254  ORF Transcript_15564/g.28254 Transcript_15564/m.28254 type:complete len:176 (-) Transcript_15564:15-542(-)
MELNDYMHTLPTVQRQMFQFALDLRDTDNQPSLIMEGLYLSSAGAAYRKDILDRYEITHILTMAENLPPLFPNDFNYKIVSISDWPNVNITAHFEECFNFINEARHAGGKVLVHCLAGISRSVTIIIAYVMATLSLSYLRALEYVKARRPWASPNSGFTKQLRHFEAHLESVRNS